MLHELLNCEQPQLMSLYPHAHHHLSAFGSELLGLDAALASLAALSCLFRSSITSCIRHLSALKSSITLLDNLTMPWRHRTRNRAVNFAGCVKHFMHNNLHSLTESELPNPHLEILDSLALHGVFFLHGFKLCLNRRKFTSKHLPQGEPLELQLEGARVAWKKVTFKLGRYLNSSSVFHDLRLRLLKLLVELLAFLSLPCQWVGTAVGVGSLHPTNRLFHHSHG